MSEPSAPVTGERLGQLWHQLTEHVKAILNMPSLWRALEAAQPIALEGGYFVIGYRPPEAYQRGLLLESYHRGIIEKTLGSLVGAPVELRVIEGTEIKDWETVKEMERAAATLRREAQARQERTETASTSWDRIGEQLARRYASMAHRTLPAVQATYVASCVETLAEACRQLMPATGDPTESDLRFYSRVLERVAERADVPASLLAYLVRERLA
ncbi:MAG: hypothetical protein HY320_04040 [Armatimonadetes bacterium]|nr:hypothetical protein [Armatimonadota bacterium]